MSEKAPESDAAQKLPYVNHPNGIPKILEKIKAAQTPDRFTFDFLTTKLGFKGGNYRQFIPLAKKLGLLNSDGTPTDLYKKFRNPATSGSAIASAMKTGYRELFSRNEYVNALKKDDLKGLIVEITGLEAANRVVNLTRQTFEVLNGLAKFDASSNGDEEVPADDEIEDQTEDIHLDQGNKKGNGGFRLGLAYTINLVLPKTDDPAVFNAIFKALRANLLRN